MLTYSIGGRSAATAATADHAAMGLWNASSAVNIWVFEVWVFKTVATVDNHALYRTTARGTPTSTLTPTINSDWDRSLAPASGTLLDIGPFTAGQPTYPASTLPLARANLPATVGAGFIWVFPEGIKVKPGEGLALVTPVTVILQPSDVVFKWRE